MLTNISNDYDKSVGSFIYDATTPAAIELEKAYQDMDDVVDMMSIENLIEDDLTQRVKERTGIDRKPATKATTTVTVTGQIGTVINVGDKVASDTVNFSFTESKMIDSSGQASVLVECDEYGTIGNVPANAIKYFPVTLAGLTSVTNPNPVTTGFDEESDADLLDRYYERLQTPATSGNKAHYKSWAKEVVGVGDVRVISCWQGALSVKVVIIDSNKQPASQTLVDQVQAYIDPNIAGTGEGTAPMGAFCTVVSAIGKIMSISFSATLAPGYTSSQAVTQVEEKLQAYYKEIAFVDDEITKQPKSVSYAIIGSKILETNAITDYTNLLVNSGTANITIGIEEVPISGGVTIV